MRVIAGIFVTLAAIFSSAGVGQVAALSSDADLPPEQRTVRIVLYPAAAPRPALKYQLLPSIVERRPGNAAVWWNRMTAERSAFFDKLYANNGPWWKAEKWMEIPIGDPREKAYREKVLAGDIGMFRGSIFSDIERAARFESCDWEHPIAEGDFLDILLPEIQQSRSYARLLSAKAHLEIVEGRYDDAVRTLQCGYALSRHVAQSQTLVSGLVGITIAGIMSHQVEQLVQQPDAPNLYWALSTLPRPLVDTRPGGEAESNMLYLQFRELRDLDKKKLSPDEWRDLLQRVLDNLHHALRFEARPPTRESLTAITTLLALQNYPVARRWLIEQGRTVSEVDAMPVAQVVLLYTVQTYRELSDEQFKWFFLPSDEVGDGLQRAERYLIEAQRRKREIIPIANLLLPAITAAKMASTRTEWTVALLRIFEAMRLYAAAHDGRWPDHLSDITEVPVPKNPYDGGSFIYRREGNKAILTAEKGPTNWYRRYEITLMPNTK